MVSDFDMSERTKVEECCGECAGKLEQVTINNFLSDKKELLVLSLLLVILRTILTLILVDMEFFIVQPSGLRLYFSLEYVL